ncbi:3-oxoacyl-ACP reductase FabG [Streptomyces sp. NPDC055078]
MSQENRIALVTGAGQGIGAAIAHRMSRECAGVVVADINEAAAKVTVDAIASAGGRAIAVACDVSNREQVEAMVERAVSELGSVDVLVNNAGVTRDNLVHKMTDDDWDLVIDTHLKGSFYCVRAAQRLMVEQRYGKIVFISSRAALGNRGQTNYSAAKAGMQGMTRTLALELGPFGINVNAIAPGHVETEMVRAVAKRTGLDYEAMKERSISVNAIKRVGQPEDIANVTAFLASEESSYITGQILYVTGRPTI